MKKVCLILSLLITGYSHTAMGQHFRFNPVYNYKTADLVKQLKIAKTDTDKLNLLFDLTFSTNVLVESPNDIDTVYLDRLLDLIHTSKIADDKPFLTIKEALHAGLKNDFKTELSLLKATVEQLDGQNTDTSFLLLEMRYMFNLVKQEDERFNYYNQKLSYYLRTKLYKSAAACAHCLAGYYSFKGDYNSAINNYLKACDLFKPFSNLWYIHELGVAGDDYSHWGNYQRCLFYLHRSMVLADSLNVNGDLDNVLIISAEAEYKLKNYQESLNYIDRINLGSPSFDEGDMSGIKALKALDYIGLDRLPAAYREIQSAYQYNAGTDLSLLIDNGYFDADYASFRYYLALKDFDKAEKYMLIYYKKTIKLGENDLRIKLLRELAEFYGDRHNTAKAWQYTMIYHLLNDSLQAKTRGFNIASYENEKVEAEQNNKLAVMQQQRAVQEATLTQRNIIIRISLIGLIAVLGSLLFLYRQLQINKRNLAHLKVTQTQLIQSEKMASLGELTTGIAHEIQNPLNFVNNFSEVNTELIDEMGQEIEKGDLAEIKAIAVDIKENEKKINMHGKRADAIVKGMLQHSQSGSGTKEPIYINALAEEYLRLSYHGLRSKDKSFNAEMVTHLDEKLPKINVIPQDIGRVLLNLFNNAFYAVNHKAKSVDDNYKPEVSVTTSIQNGHVIIKVRDNGIGIPDAIKEKIMQPFFTTKPTGEGTGLGLSLTYDMVVKGHGGSIQVNSKEGEGSEFIISLPIN